MPAPGKWQIDNGARCVNLVEQSQALGDNGTLLGLVVRFADGMAEGPFQKHRARRLHLLGVFPHDGNADGGDAGFFNNALDQSDGLIADPSARG